MSILRRLDYSAAIQELLSFLGIGTKQYWSGIQIMTWILEILQQALFWWIEVWSSPVFKSPLYFYVKNSGNFFYREMKLQSCQDYGKDMLSNVTVSDHLLSQERDQQQQQQLLLTSERQQEQRLLLTPPSRSGSRATLASLGSFSLNPITSPGIGNNDFCFSSRGGWVVRVVALHSSKTASPLTLVQILLGAIIQKISMSIAMDCDMARSKWLPDK